MANVPPEGIPYSKPSPGRNPIAELPQGNNTIWQASPRKKSHGRTSHSMANLLQHKFHMQHWDSMCDLFWEGGGGEKSHRRGTLIIWYFIRGNEIHGGIPCDTGFALFWQHDVSPTKTSKHQFHTIIINHISLEIPYISRNTSQLAHNQRLQVSG